MGGDLEGNAGDGPPKFDVEVNAFVPQIFGKHYIYIGSVWSVTALKARNYAKIRSNDEMTNKRKKVTRIWGRKEGKWEILNLLITLV